MKSSRAEVLQDYQSLQTTDLQERSLQSAGLARQFYDLATDFYEFGWGQSFHFAPRRKNESFRASIERYELRVGQALGCREGMRLLDLGCGVGGPMRTMARHFGARVTGININAYQIGRGQQHNRRQGLDARCRFVRADFGSLPLAANSYDGAYEFQATCHAPDRHAVYGEIFRVLKPGASFVGDEWCLTSGYNPASVDHRRIKKDIEVGNGLPDVIAVDAVLETLQQTGFELLEHTDLASRHADEKPWYAPLSDGWSLTGMPRTRAGRFLTRNSLRGLEAAHLVPRGCAGVSDLLNTGADALVRGGETGVFTPLYFFHARKPVEPAAGFRGTCRITGRPAFSDELT